MSMLHVFALNEPVAVTHTHLTRQKGEVAVLPPLAEWLGVEAIDTNEIELFAINDLSDMGLSDYITLAFAPETAIPSATVTRLDALDGAVLLVPERALSGPATPGPKATLIASLALAQADHGADLPKAKVAPLPTAAPPARHEAGPPLALYALIAMAILAALIFFVGWS